MKAFIQYILQKVLGIKTYLYLFSWYKIKTLKWDKGENDFFHFLSIIPKDGDILDIGANIGIMAYHLSINATKEQVVHGFEPIPYNSWALNKIKTKFNLTSLKTYSIALGNKNQELEMILPVVDGVLKQGLSHVKDPKMKDFNEGQTFKCEAYKLDDLDWIKNKSISAIKIDVENFEYEVFEGAEETIKNNKPYIYAELWDNENRSQCFNFFKNLNYNIKVLHMSKLEQFDPSVHTSQNFFFIPK